MNYYQNIITQKSWQVLKKIRREFDFVLIGGWAVWAYTKTLKSKDIDIIVNYQTLSFLKEKWEIAKNERLKKYEAKLGEVDIDIYLPYWSNPGLPPEEIQKHLLLKEGFKVPRLEVLLILKQVVFEQRKASVKGQKDKIDIFALLKLDLNFTFYQKILREQNCPDLAKNLGKLLGETKRVPELGLANHQMAKLRKRITIGLK